jgi:hypothetical protein
MAAAPGTTIVLLSGAVTFTGEWYWNKTIDWKVPLATILLAGGFEVMSNMDRNGATLLSLMVFAGAMSTKFSGHSAFDMVTALLSGGKQAKTNPASTTKQKATNG